MSAEDWRAARIAAELVRNVLAPHDWHALIEQGARAETIGPMTDPTLYRKRGQLVREDLEVFRAAARFLGTWGDRPLAPACFEPTPADVRLPTRAQLLKPVRSGYDENGAETFDFRIWSWRPFALARLRYVAASEPVGSVEDLRVGIEHPIGGFPCSLDMLNKILFETQIAAVPGIEVQIRFSQGPSSCAVGFEVFP